MSPIRFAKRLVDSNELPWMLPVWPWRSESEKKFRRLRMRGRALLRSQLVARQGWGFTVSQSLVWPAMAVLKAVLAVRKAQLGLGEKIRLLGSFCWIQWIHNISISNQQQLMLARRGHAGEGSRHIICREHQALLELAMTRMWGYEGIHEKQTFARFGLENGLPTVKSVAEGEGATILTEMESWPLVDLFLKPSNLGKGVGAERLYYRKDQGAWYSRDEVRVERAGFPAYVMGRLGGESWVLQPALKNAESWAGFTTGALVTARIVTVREGAEIRCFQACVRLPRRGSVVDNLSAGGLASEIDRETGRLAGAMGYFDNLRSYAVHPDTGAQIEGLILPGWPEMKALVFKAHEAAGNWLAVGWDVTWTEEGALLIEANLNWAILPLGPMDQGDYIRMMAGAQIS